MWPFHKMYYVEDWGILDSNIVYITDGFGRCSMCIKFLLENRRTGKIKKLSVGLGLVSCYSRHAMRDKLLTKYGIVLGAKKFWLRKKPIKIKDN